MTSAIYQIRNTVSGGIYFGRSVNAEDRMRHHYNELRRGVHSNKRLQNAWNKYGESAFTFNIVWEEAASVLCELEGFILECAWGDPRLYNHHKLSYGGFEPGNTMGCFTRSPETKERMSRAFKGRVFSEQHKEKISSSRKGKRALAKTKQKMSEIRLGIPRPQSWHDKMSGKFLGANNPMFGKPSPMRGKHYPTVECEHCGKAASKGNYLRWHGANCRKK